MAYSYVTYTANGVTTQFAVPFGYIRREHVFVNINQVSQSYTWVNDSTVQLAAAPANGVKVEVRRSTPAAASLVDFSDGATLVAADLDTSNQQLLYLEQELLDNQGQTVSVDPATGLPSLSGNRLTNVGNPVSAQDAATKTYVDTFVSQTANIANNAVTTAKIADGAVTSAKIADGTIATVDLADGSVTAAKIADGNVTTAKVATGAISNDKLADADLQTLAGAQTGAAAAFALLTAAEVATLDGIAATTSELNQLGGKTITGSLNPANANDIPTSTAINSWVSNLINALGGFVAIPNRTSFPTSNPDPSDDAGTVVSIADAGGLVVSAGGVATNGQTTGAAAVTITGFPAVYQSTTLVAGLGIQVQTTSTLNTYTFHKSIPTDADIVQLNDDINNFFARYRYGAVNPTTDLDAGDLFFNTTLGKMLVYDGITSSWKEVQSFGSFSINTLSSSPNAGGGSATFNGTAYRFTLSNPPSFAQQLLVSINGVIQKPNSGTTQPTEGFAVNQADIIFSQAPASGSSFFIVTIGSSVDIGAPSDGTVTTAKLANGAVTPAKLSTGGPFWDTSGRLLVGTSSARSNLYNAAYTPSVQFETLQSAGLASRGLSLAYNNNTDTGGAILAFITSRGSTQGSNTLVANGDELGLINFTGTDGTRPIIGAGIAAYVDGTPGNLDMPGRLVFSTTADGASSPTERMRITSGGRLFVNTQTFLSASYLAHFSSSYGGGVWSEATGGGDACYTSRSPGDTVGMHYAGVNNAGTIVYRVNQNGDVRNTNNSYGAISDQKLKENIVDAASQWDDIKAFRVRKYNFKGNDGQSTHTQIGLVAQEVEQISPGLVAETTDYDLEGNDLGTVTKSVNYSVLYMKAVKALQEAMERIETLEAKVAALEAA